MRGNQLPTFVLERWRPWEPGLIHRFNGNLFVISPGDFCFSGPVRSGEFYEGAAFDSFGSLTRSGMAGCSPGKKNKFSFLLKSFSESSGRNFSPGLFDSGRNGSKLHSRISWHSRRISDF